MSSAFLQLRAALVDHLLAAPPLAAGRVRAAPVRPIAQGEPSAINVRVSDAQISHSVIEAADWRTTVYIDCMARSVPAQAIDADTAADDLLSSVFERLHTFADSAAAQGLAVLYVDQDATVEWDHVAEDVPYTCASLRVTLTHRTPATTLQPWT